MNHYRTLKFFSDSKRDVRISSNYKLMPTHCKVLAISEKDETILAAAKTINYVNSEFDGDEKLKHKRIIQ